MKAGLGGVDTHCRWLHAGAWNKVVFEAHPKPFCASMIYLSLDNVLATLHCQGMFAVGLGEFGRFGGGEQLSLLCLVTVPWDHQFCKAQALFLFQLV